jgi:hemerythrin superfamily protein
MAGTPRTPLDAIELLLQDHREVEALFRDFEHARKAGGAEAAQIISDVCDELIIHDKIEAEIFYPAVREAADDEEIEDMLDDAEDDHDDILELIEAIEDLDADDTSRDAQFAALAGQVTCHVEEEESNLFVRVRTLKALDLVALATEMKARRSELMGDMGVALEGETV